MHPRTVTIEIPEPHFTLFNAKRSGLPEVIVVNDALLGFPHIEAFSWHLCVTLGAMELIENGMPSECESSLLFEIGDEIEEVVLGGRTEHGGINALFLARSTWNEQRELLFQVHDPEVADTALQALLESRQWQRDWDYRMKQDFEWSSAANVFQLFPQANGSDA
jgi:hypothetical protein